MMESANSTLRAIGELGPLALVLVFLTAMVVITILMWRGSEKLGIHGVGKEWARIAENQIKGNEIAQQILEGQLRLEGRILKDLDETKADLKLVNARLVAVEIELASTRGPSSSKAGAGAQPVPPTPRTATPL